MKNVFLITDTIFLLAFISCWSLHFLEGRVYRQLNLTFRNSLFFSDSAAVAVVKYNNRDFKIQRRDGNENVKKTIGFISKTTTSHVHHAFLYISFLFLRDYDVKMPNFASCGGRKQATAKFYFSF